MDEYDYFVVRVAETMKTREALAFLDTLRMLRPVGRVVAIANSWGDGFESAADLVSNPIGLVEEVAEQTGDPE